MSFFSSPLDEDLVSRVEQDEDEERIAERAIEANGGVLPKVFPAWSKAARDRIADVGSIAPDVMFVAAGDFACDLVHDGVAAGGIAPTPLGALAVAGIPAKGLTLEPSAEDDAGIVHDLGAGVVAVAARYDVPRESCREWATTLLSAVNPSRVVVLCAVDEHDVGYGVDGYRGSFVLDTAAQRCGIHSLSLSDDDDERSRPGATRGGAHRGDRRGGRGEMRDDRCPRAHRRGPRAERHRGREGVREREARRRAGEAAAGNRTWLRGRRRRSGGVARGPVDSTRVRDRLRGVRAERSLGGCVVEEADVRGGRRRHARVHLGARY